MRLALFTAAALLAATSTGALADRAEDAVKARQGIFQNFKWHIGPMVAIAKGQADYDAEAAQHHADMLAGLTPYLGGLFIEGTSNAERDDTDALPKIWEDQAGFGQKAEDFNAAVTELVAVAGDGKDVMVEQFAAVGNACKACHDTYRADN
ncbi:MAG: c-type cytochrome [Geminicoccaceae bacterium]